MSELDADLVARAHSVLDRAALVAEARSGVLGSDAGHAAPASRPPRSAGTSLRDEIAGLLEGAATDDELLQAIRTGERRLRRRTHSPGRMWDPVEWETIGERRRAALSLHGRGYSLRHIAVMLGVSHPTVLRDLHREDEHR